MTDKVTLAAVGSLVDATTAQATINANNAAIVTAMNKTLSRDGTSPNQMQAALDMNSNRIINLPQPISGSEPLRLTDLSLVPGNSTVNISPLPVGGTTNQLLTKNSSTNYDVSWQTLSQSGTGLLPTGGTAAQVLTKNSSTNYDASWVAPTTTALKTVKDAPYNAVGNGVANDTAAIQAMIDASAPGHLSGLVSQIFPVIIPPGTYKISELNCTNIMGFTMIGQGSGTTYPMFTWAGTATNSMIDMTGSCAGARLESFYMTGPISDGTFGSYPVMGILFASSLAGGANFNAIRNVNVQGRFQQAALYIYGVSNSRMDHCGFVNAQQVSPNSYSVVYTASNAAGMNSSFTTIQNLSNAGGSDWLMSRCEFHCFTGGSTTSPKAILLEGPMVNYQFNNGVIAAANGFIVEIKGTASHVGFCNITFYTDQGPQASVAVGSTAGTLAGVNFDNVNVVTATGLYSFGSGTITGILTTSTVVGGYINIAGVGSSAAINGVHI